MSSKGALTIGPALMQLHEACASGVVRFERGKSKKQLFLRGGHVAFGESNEPEEHLVRTMIRMGTLSRRALPGLAALMKKGLTADAALFSAGEADANAVHAGVREQACGIVASLLGWNDLQVRYYAGRQLLTRNLDIQLEVPVLLADAARRAASTRSSAALPRGMITLMEDSLNLAMKLPLDAAEAYACSLAAEPLALEDFLNLMPSGGAAAPGEVLRTLLLLGLVRVQPMEAEARCEQENDSVAAEIEEMLRRFEIADYYEILSVPVDAGQDAVKAAYHELARRYHPDLFHANRFRPELRKQAEKLFTYMTAAYTTLGNAASRAAYDEQRATRMAEALQARAGADLDREKASLALFRVGQQALLEQDLEKAVVTFGECVFLKPDAAKYRHALGRAQAEIPRHRKEAERNLLKAIELDPMALESYIALGRLYVKVNLTRRAEAQFRQVLKWDPGNPEAERALKELEIGTG